MLDFWLAVVGIGFIGFLNLTVSFSLTFFIAIKSKNTKTLQKKAIYLSVLKRLKQEPLSFILPRKSKASDHTNENSRDGDSQNPAR